MFAVYGISGPIFQGTLENLGPLGPVVRIGAVIAARRVGDLAQPDALTEPTHFAVTPRGSHEPAIDAYQAMRAENLERGPIYEAQQLMQREIVTVAADDDVAGAWRILTDHQIAQAPVLDAASHVVGIVGVQNLLATLAAGERQMDIALARRVDAVMATPVVCASPETDIRRIARVMIERRVDCVPIVNESGKLVGLIGRGDILHAVVADPPLSIWR